MPAPGPRSIRVARTHRVRTAGRPQEDDAMPATSTTTRARDESPVQRPRRFSEGLERTPLDPSSWRVGRFSDGLGRSPAPVSTARSGSFADGLARAPRSLAARRVGGFADRFACPGDAAGVRPGDAPARRVAAQARPA
jgi:hypothetical protein